jgi:hypothetical protein
MEFGLGILPENYRAVALTWGRNPAPRRAVSDSDPRPGERDRVVLTPEAAGIEYSVRGRVAPLQADLSRRRHGHSLPSPLTCPESWLKNAYTHLRGNLVATYPSKLDLSELARSMSSPAHRPAENRFEIFGLGSHHPGGLPPGSPRRAKAV